MDSAIETIHVLMVDDQNAPVRELKRALEELSPSEFKFDVVWVPTVTEYHQAILKQNTNFDVLIADLKLERGEDLRQGIDEVVSWHLLHSPSTVVLVYSVFTSDAGDSISTAIETCVMAMRAGAADCIKKGHGSTARLVNSICRELRERRDPTLVFDSEWWADHHESLQNEYSGQAIAVLGKNVIAAASTVPELRVKLKEIDSLRSLRTRHSTTDLPRIILVPDYED